jgi:hypothetical protein
LDAGFVFNMPKTDLELELPFQSPYSISNWRRSGDTLSQNSGNCACVT